MRILALITLFLFLACENEEAKSPLEKALAKSNGYPVNTAGKESFNTDRELVLYHILLGSGIDGDLQDTAYLNFMARSYGANPQEIKNAILLVDSMEYLEDIYDKINLKILSNLEKLDSLDKASQAEFYIKNIFAPHLSLLINNRKVNFANQEEMVRRFPILFSVGNSEEPGEFNALKGFFDEWKRYKSTGYFEISTINLLNSYFKTKGFYFNLRIREEHANFFRIDSLLYSNVFPKDLNTEKVRQERGIHALLLKRMVPQLLTNSGGFSFFGDPDVVVVEEVSVREVGKFAVELDSAKLSSIYTPSWDSLFKDMGISLTHKEANKILLKLTQMDFAGMEREKMTQILLDQTARHELKHKVDERFFPHIKLDVDLEVAAHLVQGIEGKAPYQSLRDAVNRFEGFYQRVPNNNTEMKKRLAGLLNKVWSLAKVTVEETKSRDFVKSQLQEIYSSYRTLLSNEPLPPLASYQ